MRRTSRLPCASPALASGGRRMDGLLCQHFARVVSTPGRACPPGSLPASLVVAVRGRRVRVALVRSVHDARGLDVVAVLIPGRRHNGTRQPRPACTTFFWKKMDEKKPIIKATGLQQIPRGFSRAGGPGRAGGGRELTCSTSGCAPGSRAPPAAARPPSPATWTGCRTPPGRPTRARRPARTLVHTARPHVSSPPLQAECPQVFALKPPGLPRIAEPKPFASFGFGGFGFGGGFGEAGGVLRESPKGEGHSPMMVAIAAPKPPKNQASPPPSADQVASEGRGKRGKDS